MSEKMTAENTTEEIKTPETVMEQGTEADVAAEMIVAPAKSSEAVKAEEVKKEGIMAKLKKFFGETEQEKRVRERKEAILNEVRSKNPAAYDEFVKKNGGPAKYMRYDEATQKFVDATVYGTTIGSSSEQQISN